uniref:HTH myb-type domain-containing protein n=1 Tax=Timspurckia oligopyrenoides TaxID=708627 RepID=A0A7S1EQ36_9RHOD|mmetsp:Transcript_11041/g.19965  ORF Transcript_11041/g.19965 Transcript_11041/m.19965 type:complete len:200 (+) Transcript_11041:33-632(+)|eukprot:CAMPEP_0182441290 /NCGR_PEP_ID=MMETSP1172-20130603/222_1 /TAXON_ID=708627 /ORGANISM="Timspurckia oligopyrenoides, Strain CCMP3278" /LENGTH=199 /DNA_ID=CAMNT_0024635473 /DNA_START=32 /DNA_END=631 /DNA_ORIENTATION=+
MRSERSGEVPEVPECDGDSSFGGKERKKYVLTKRREYWTDGEHSRFVSALMEYGRDWKQIELAVGTKSAVQIRSHAQKYFIRLERNEVSAKDENIVVPPPRPRKKSKTNSASNISSISPSVEADDRQGLSRVDSRLKLEAERVIQDHISLLLKAGNYLDMDGKKHEKVESSLGARIPAFSMLPIDEEKELNHDQMVPEC